MIIKWQGLLMSTITYELAGISTQSTLHIQQKTVNLLQKLEYSIYAKSLVNM